LGEAGGLAACERLEAVAADAGDEIGFLEHGGSFGLLARLWRII
jgi:hypothetical protein